MVNILVDLLRPFFSGINIRAHNIFNELWFECFNFTWFSTVALFHVVKLSQLKIEIGKK